MLFKIEKLLLTFLLFVLAAVQAAAAPVSIDDVDAGFRTLSGSNRRTVESYSWAPRAVLGADTFSTTDDQVPLTTFAWYFTKLAPGAYAVYGSWPARSDAAVDALYMIQTSEGRKGSFQDQTKAPTIAKSGKYWASLGTVLVGADGVLDVKVSNNTASNSVVLADSVLVESAAASPLPSPLAVPAPWSPIAVDNAVQTAQTFNSTFSISPGPLPAVSVNGISHGGPQLFLTQGGVERPVTGANTVDLLSGDQIKLHGQMPVVGGQVVWQSALEYDNFYKVSVTIVPDSFSSGVLVENLHFQWTLPASLVTMASAPGIGGHPYLTDSESTLMPFVTGQTDRWDGWFGQDTGPGRDQPPVLWLGSDRSGITWQAESDENFAYDQPQPAFDYRKLLHLTRNRTAGTVTMAIDMMYRADPAHIPPIAVNRPLRFTFAVQTTPVRPPAGPSNRGFLVGSFSGQSDSHNIYGWDGAYFTTDKGSSIPIGTSTTSGELASHIGWYPGGLFPYTSDWWACDQFGAAHADWWQTINQQPVRTGTNGRELRLSPSSEQWREHFLTDAARLLAEPYISGMYVDVNHINTSDNRSNYDFVVDDWGRTIYRNWQIWAQRTLLKNLYQLHARNGKLLFVHQHNDDVPAVHGWGHLSLPGEDSYQRIGTEPLSYIEDLKTVTVQSNNSDNQRLVGYPLVYWQSLKRMGTYPIFLNQYARASGGITADGQQLKSIDQSNPALVRALIAMLGLHDIGLFGTWLAGSGGNYGHAEGLAYNNLMKRWRGAKFYGYWEQQKFSSGNPNLLISYYEKPDGSVLIWLTNRSNASLSAVVSRQSVSVPAQDFRYLELNDVTAPAAPQGLSIR